MSNSEPREQISDNRTPDYVGLVKFLMHPFLEVPESLKVDCETFPKRSRVLLRMAFEDEDKGRVFGRGGRNIQAVRVTLQAVAQANGMVAHLEIYGGEQSSREEHRSEGRSEPRSEGRSGSHRPPSRRSPRSPRSR